MTARKLSLTGTVSLGRDVLETGGVADKQMEMVRGSSL